MFNSYKQYISTSPSPDPPACPPPSLPPAFGALPPGADAKKRDQRGQVLAGGRSVGGGVKGEQNRHLRRRSGLGLHSCRHLRRVSLLPTCLPSSLPALPACLPSCLPACLPACLCVLLHRMIFIILPLISQPFDKDTCSAEQAPPGRCLLSQHLTSLRSKCGRLTALLLGRLSSARQRRRE